MSTMISKRQLNMTSGPLAKNILLFALPLMASNVLQLFFNAADVIIVGHFAGDGPLAAVGSTTPLVQLITQLFIGLSTGVNVVAARFIGEDHPTRVKSVVQTAILTSILSGFFLLIIGIIGAKTFLTWMLTPEDVLDLATTYLRIFFIGMPFLMIFNFGSAILRAIGDTRRPMIFLTIAGVVNVALNCFFVIVLHMDVEGVALATIISQAISGTLVLICLCRETGVIHLDIKQLRISGADLALISKIGIPAGVQGIVFSLSNVVIQSSLNSFGSVVMAGSAAAVSSGDFIFIALNSFHFAALSFCSQNLGAKESKRIDKTVIYCLLYVLVLGLILCGLYMKFSHAIISLYSPGNEEVIAAGVERIMYSAGFLWLCGLMDVMPGAIRGLGYSTVPAIISLIGSCALRLLWIATYFQVHHTIKVLYLSYPLSWIITFIAQSICYIIVKKKINKTLA